MHKGSCDLPIMLPL